MTPSNPPQRRFVPHDVDLSDWAHIEPLTDSLLARPIGSSKELETWLFDLSELYAAVDESGARKYIAKSCNTEDPGIEAAFLHHVEHVEPRFKQAFFELQKKFIASPYRGSLEGPRYAMLNRNWEAEVALFRPENVALETQATKVVNEYDKIFGSMMIDFRGQQYTPQFMARFLMDPDRPTREEAFRATASARLAHRERIDELFDQLLQIRQQIAANAGFDNYRDYAFKLYKRFDYGPAECKAYADAIEQAVAPILRDMEERRKRDLGLETLRPWDMDVDPQNRPPLAPFEPRDINGFVGKTREIFKRLSPDLASDFDKLHMGTHLDLDSRKGKQPGGYQSSLEESKQPFIFMNAAGLQGDVRTLLHEGGHAFHYQWASSREPLVFLRSPPMEFAEVASMSMELLGMEHFDVYYGDGEDNLRARREQLEGCIPILGWIATIDQFQHWLYTNQGHTRQQRTQAWRNLLSRYYRQSDWTGLEDIRDARWQAQLHLFHVPFYYIEYGIAQLGALQLWIKSQQDTHQALANYRAGLSLGGTAPLPKLFATAGLTFDFSLKTVGPLMNVVRDELKAMA